MSKIETSKNADKMGNHSILPLLIKMAVPAILSMIVYALYNVIDSIFVAQYSHKALTAVSLAFPIQMLIISVGVGTGVGINSLISRKLGQGNKEDANLVASYGLVLGAIASITFMILGFAITRPFLEVFAEGDEELIVMGVQYLSTIMIFSFGSFLEINIEKTIQATGNMVVPMIFMLIGGVTNLILDPLFIFGIGIFPELGVLGAAVATVAGQILSMIVAFVVIFTTKQDVKFSFKGFRVDFSILKEIFAVAIPSIIMQSIGTVMIIGMNSILITFSQTAVSVLGIYFKLQSFIFMPVFGLMQGGMPIIGYNYGAGNKERLLKTLKYCIIISVSIMTLGTALFMIFPSQLLMMFNANKDMISIGETALRAISLCFIFAGVSIVIINLFQAIGRGISSMIVSFTRQLILLLPVAYGLSFINLDVVWYAFPISEIVALILSIIIMIRIYNKYIKNLKLVKR